MSEVASLQQTRLIEMQGCAITLFRQLSAVDKVPGFSSLWAIVKKICSIHGVGFFFLYTVPFLCSDDVSVLWTLCWKSSGDIKVLFFRLNPGFLC